MRVNEIMTAPVHTVPSGMPLEEAAALMRRHRVRHLVVKDARQVVGVISDHDVREAATDSGREDLIVRDLMSLNVATVAEDDTIRRAANLMRGRSIGCVAVTRQRELVGILTVSDLLTLLGKGGERRSETARASLHYRVPHRKQKEKGARSW